MQECLSRSDTATRCDTSYISSCTRTGLQDKEGHCCVLQVQLKGARVLPENETGISGCSGLLRAADWPTRTVGRGRSAAACMRREGRLVFGPTSIPRLIILGLGVLDPRLRSPFSAQRRIRHGLAVVVVVQAGDIRSLVAAVARDFSALRNGEAVVPLLVCCTQVGRKYQFRLTSSSLYSYLVRLAVHPAL